MMILVTKKNDLAQEMTMYWILNFISTEKPGTEIKNLPYFFLYCRNELVFFQNFVKSVSLILISATANFQHSVVRNMPLCLQWFFIGYWIILG